MMDRYGTDQKAIQYNGNIVLALIAWDYFTSKRNRQLPYIMEVKICRNLCFFFCLRGCSYGVELAPPSLRNSYKNIMCSYERWANPPRWYLIWFCWDPTKVRWKFSTWTRASGKTRHSGLEFFLKSFFF